MKWFWIVTLSWADPRGQAYSTCNGTISQASSLTREEAFQAVVDTARSSNNVPQGTSAHVVFFSLEPDALTSPATEPAHAAGGA